MWMLFIALLIVFEAFADILAKEWSLKGHAARWLAAIAAYIVANAFWLYSLKSGAGLSRGAIVFSVASAILAIGIGVVLYKEDVTKLQLAGMFVGIISIALLLWE